MGVPDHDTQPTEPRIEVRLLTAIGRIAWQGLPVMDKDGNHVIRDGVIVRNQHGEPVDEYGEPVDDGEREPMTLDGVLVYGGNFLDMYPPDSQHVDQTIDSINAFLGMAEGDTERADRAKNFENIIGFYLRLPGYTRKEAGS